MKSAVSRWLELAEIDLKAARVGLLPDGLPDLEDAKAFYDYAREVYNKVKAILR